MIGLARIQVDRARLATRERVANLFLRLLAHPEATVRVAVLERLASQPIPDPSRVILSATLDSLRSAIPDERAIGIRAALASSTDSDAARFAQVFTELLPRRRELADGVEAFVIDTLFLGRSRVAVRSAVLAAVEAGPRCLVLQVRLASALLAAKPFAQWVSQFVATDNWHIGLQTAVANVMARKSESTQEMERAEAIWAAATDPALRWLGLRLLTQVAVDQGWDAARRERLHRYQADPCPVVADAAAFTFPPLASHQTNN